MPDTCQALCRRAHRITTSTVIHLFKDEFALRSRIAECDLDGQCRSGPAPFDVEATAYHSPCRSFQDSTARAFGLITWANGNTARVQLDSVTSRGRDHACPS